MMVTQSYLLIIFLFILNLAGCVGTVQETATQTTLQESKKPNTFSFDGITAARGIAHDKVEIEFFPTSGSNISYSLYVNNSQTPIIIDPAALTPLSGGKYLYTVQNLDINRQYKFKLTAKNIATGAISANEKEAYATTFDNRVSSFNGISKVSLIPGKTTEAIKIDWIAASVQGIFTAGPYDPVYYEVTIISDVGGAANLNNPLYTGTDRKVKIIPESPARASPFYNPDSLTVDGLSPNTKYYVQVRSINALYQDFKDSGATNIPVDREKNTKYLSIKTASSSSLFDFAQEDIILTNVAGVDSFDKIDIFWQTGSGSFTGYRIFARKYDGAADPTTDDKLTEATLVAMNASNSYTSVASTDTSKRISGLDSYAWYQVKVVLCKTIACPVSSSSPDGAIISDLKAIRVQPSLAAFGGIFSIEPPGQYNERDVVNLRFDAPIVSSGFANELEFYCVDPADHSQMVKFIGTTAISGSGIAICEGLSLSGTVPAIDVYTTQKVEGLINDGSHQYCFAATPAIIGYGIGDVRLDPQDRIVRCAYPEVNPPSISQFPGLSSGCSINGTTATVNWSLPQGGIYSGFKVYWREKDSLNKFSFPSAIASAAGYTQSASLAANLTSYNIPNLSPGKTYSVGVLAEVDMSPSPNLYSEYNLNINDCSIPLPIADFQGFSRILAIGPKYDGRIPNDSSKAPPASAKIFEAINADGIPYEVAMDSLTVPSLTNNYTAPPGRDYGASFSAGFDGAPETTSNYAMSKNGIVSLAWEEVVMKNSDGSAFTDADAIFLANQPAAPALRTGRTYGYKVYRSNDNKLTWKDLTPNGPVYSTSYTYYPRPNATGVTKRMAFFTDYSVMSLDESHDSTNEIDVDRARIYYYKIVPLFNSKLLSYNGKSNHIVRVTLPPPNMALVHRWMANRGRCIELNKAPNIELNYSCDYNGIGSTPRSIPWRTGDTALDQGGDLLIDRFELGCRYTRGAVVSDPELGESFFDKEPSKRNAATDTNSFPLFKGYATSGGTDNVAMPFKGCTGTTSTSRGATGTAADYPGSFTADYQHFLQGDCLGPHGELTPLKVCTSQQFNDGGYDAYTVTTPGAPVNPTVLDCSADTASGPTTVETKFKGAWAPNIVMQSELLAVYYNTYSTAMTASTYYAPFEGPNTGSLSSSRVLNISSESNFKSNSQCSINLAAIDGSGYWKPRWASVNHLGGSLGIRFKNSTTTSLLTKTVQEVLEVNQATAEPLTLYNGSEGDGTAAAFKRPSSTFTNSNRYRLDTKLARVVSSNMAKLPPLGRLDNVTAQEICSTYYVQVGSASDNGNFSALGVAKAKRPVRRPESITASAWPEHYASAEVTNLETSNTAGACNTINRSMTGVSLNKGLILTNKVPFYSNTLTGTPLVTGSSDINWTSTEVHHTKNCVSKFGIQDMVGNQQEINSERIFCDYSQDKSYLGPVSGGWGGGSSATNQGNGGPDIEFFNTDQQKWYAAVLKSGATTDGSYNGFKITFDNGNPTITDAKPWVKISTDSGYCSFVDKSPSRRDPAATNVFKDINGLWYPLFLPGGSLNTTMVTESQYDQEAVLNWRNGDGRFFDFGPNGIGAPFNKGNTLALQDNYVNLTGYQGQSKYFNPVVGFPLKCSTDACNDISITGFNDNTAITTSYLNSNIASGIDDTPTVNNFPTFNSQIFHLGVSDYQFSAMGYTSISVPLYSTGGTSNISQMLVEVRIDTSGNPNFIYKTFPDDWTPGTTVEYYKVSWDVDRNTDFSIASGGRSSNNGAGRYTAAINPVYPQTGTTDFNSGTRCAILINQD
ncbi:MAG: fibronectin type III domain-containing protein [Bacteriovoracaceae bacterium]